ncbi:hypothetical protein LSM04_005972 [Trypanosoma melophagium]|uniref:uncharacterized protein n=1 Tax=Trypanosoma melophagium TaxID=715481 RepID=UPI00351A70A6|nr:hypothetical protein LSM04_005972 [Trypanosoma melophagium]
MEMTQPPSHLTSHANALLATRLDLLEVLCKEKAVLLALEEERHKLFLYTYNARLTAFLLENEKLFQQLCLKKFDLFNEFNPKHHVIHKHLSHEKRGPDRKNVVAHLEISSPLLHLDPSKNEINDSSQQSTKAGIDVLVIPLNSEFEIECSLVLNDDDSHDNVWKEQQRLYLESIHRIPFILTYISGDATLSDECNTLAYAQCRRKAGRGIQIVRFSHISLHLAKASSQHVLLVTHPRTKYCVIQPLEVPVLTLAPPVIAVEETKYVDVELKSSEMHPQISDMELHVRVSIKTDDNISRVVLTCHEQHRNGQKYYVGISEIRDEECEEYRVGNGHWCFHRHMPMRASGALDSGGLMVLLVEVSLTSMQHHVFKESFQITAATRKRRSSFQSQACFSARDPPLTNTGEKDHLESSRVKRVTISNDSEKHVDPNNQGDRMAKNTSSTSDFNDPHYSYGRSENNIQSSTGKTNDGEGNISLSSFVLDDYGQLAVTCRNGNSASLKIPHLVWFTHSTDNTISSDTHVPIKGLNERMLQVTANTCSSGSHLGDSEWTLEYSCDTSRKWLLQNPRGGSIVLSPNKSQTLSVESCCFCGFFPPSLNSPAKDDQLVEQLFVESLQYLVQRWTSGTIVSMDSKGGSRVLVNDGVAICLWEPGDDEDTNLLVIAHRGSRFSVYSLNTQEIVLHSNLQSTVNLSDNSNVQEYRGITSVLGGGSVVLWSFMTVELLSHAPTWKRQVLYKVELKDTYIMTLCSAQNASMVLFLLLSSGTILGLSLDGNTQQMGHLPSHDSLAPPSLSSSSCLLGVLTTSQLRRVSKLTMRHVKLNEQLAICVCGLSEGHILLRTYISLKSIQ